MRTFFTIFFTLFIVSIGCTQTKISDALLEDIQKAINEGTPVEALVVLNDQFDTDALVQQRSMLKSTAHDQGVAVVTSLMEHAQRTQAGLISLLDSRTGTDVISYKQFWISNIILVKARPEFLFELAQREDVAMLEENEKVQPIKPVSMRPAPAMPGHAEPGLKVINADKMWKLGFTGQGVITGIYDGGVDGLHPALSRNWHGNKVPATQAWRDYNYNTTFPTDAVEGHGTLCAGIMAGLDSITADTIGVAFGSEWIAARQITYSTAEIIDAYQWFLDPDGNPNTTDDMPVVSNNSWGGGSSCSPPYITALRNLENAGVAVIFSVGNAGPGAYSVDQPGMSNYNALQVFTVGGVDGNNDKLPIAWFSSRGPTTCNQGGDNIKPEVVAPGQGVRSSWPDGLYVTISGTSLSSPYVCGAIALLKQAFPDKSGTELKQMLYETARDLGEPGEDNTYGMGIIDVYQAYLENVVPENPHSPTRVIATSDYLTPNEVALTWTDPSTLVNGDSLVSFEISIYRDNTPITAVPIGVAMFADSGLTDGQRYEYILKTHDLVSGNMSAERKVAATAGGSAIPSPPVITTAKYDTLVQGVRINWTDPATQSDGTHLDDLAKIFIYCDGKLYDSVAPGTQTYLDEKPPTLKDATYMLVAADTEEPQNFSQPTRKEEVFLGAKPDILIFYGQDDFSQFPGTDFDYSDSIYLMIRSFNIPVHKTDNLSEFGVPLHYDAVFVITRMRDQAHFYILRSNTASDYNNLLNYLNKGGSLYIEGSMCFNFYNKFQICYEGWNIRSWLGLKLGDWTNHPADELTGLNDLNGLNFQYTGADDVWDILSPSTSTRNLWEDPSNGNILGVYNEYNTGKIIGVVPPYGDIGDPAHPIYKKYLMCRYLKMLGVDVECEVGMEENPAGSNDFSVVQVIPNPFTGNTSIVYVLEEDASVTLILFNQFGQKVATLANETQSAGRHQVNWNTNGLPAGVYYYRLQADGDLTTGKITKLR